jgi:hypothetical protein
MRDARPEDTRKLPRFLGPLEFPGFTPLLASWPVIEIDMRKLLARVVDHDEAGVKFLDRPGRREAAKKQTTL